jgi:hypothetical protein
MKRRRFTQDFKRSVVEQLLSETAGPAELCRRHNIASGYPIKHAFLVKMREFWFSPSELSKTIGASLG